MTFQTIAGRTTCLACGARIGNTRADKIEHVLDPGRAHAAQRRAQTIATTTEGNRP